MVECPICISHFKRPVCLPCGHLFCKECIVGYVNSPGNTDMTAPCPECRAVFHLATPDVSYLPEKYHPFIVPSMRRVYIDLKGDLTLQQKLNEAEDRLATKRQAEQALIVRCEGLVAAVNAHRFSEREAMEYAEELEEKLDEAKGDYRDSLEANRLEIVELRSDNRSLVQERQRMKEENRGLLHERRQMEDELQALKDKLAISEAKRRELERTLPARHETSTSSNDFDTSHSHSDRSRDIPRQRVIKPLPKRRVTRDDEGVSICGAAKRPRYPLETVNHPRRFLVAPEGV